MVTATLVKKLDGWRGDASLYRLSESVPYGYEGDQTTDHVVVSSVMAYSGPETYIFPADAEGEVLEYSEMEGSYRGSLNHAAAITGAGWTLGDSK